METLEQVAARHGMTAQQWERLPASERLTRERNSSPPPEKKTRPHELVVALTDEEKTTLAALPLTERVTRFRQILAERGTKQ